jgi:hypothetical protein
MLRRGTGPGIALPGVFLRLRGPAWNRGVGDPEYVQSVVVELLFYGGDLRGTLENIKASLAEDIAKTPDEHVLEADEDAWADALAERYRVEAPALRRDEMWQESPERVDVDVSHDFSRAVFPGERALISGYRVVMHIPLTAMPASFSCGRANSR